MYIQRSTAKIRTPAHGYLTDHDMTASTACVIAQQYSSATFVPLRFHSLKEKIPRIFNEKIKFLFYVFKNCLCFKLCNTKLRKYGISTQSRAALWCGA